MLISLASQLDVLSAEHIVKNMATAGDAVNALREALRHSPNNLPLRLHLAETLIGLARFAGLIGSVIGIIILLGAFQAIRGK